MPYNANSQDGSAFFSSSQFVVLFLIALDNVDKKKKVVKNVFI